MSLTCSANLSLRLRRATRNICKHRTRVYRFTYLPRSESTMHTLSSNIQQPSRCAQLINSYQVNKPLMAFNQAISVEVIVAIAVGLTSLLIALLSLWLGYLIFKQSHSSLSQDSRPHDGLQPLRHPYRPYPHHAYHEVSTRGMLLSPNAVTVRRTESPVCRGTRFEA